MAQDRNVYWAIAIRDEWIVAVSQDPHGLDSLISAGTRVLDASEFVPGSAARPVSVTTVAPANSKQTSDSIHNRWASRSLPKRLSAASR